jgi:hypothetical protein
MNANGLAAVDIRAEAAATAPWLTRTGYVVLAGGAALLATATLLIVVPVRRVSS